MLSPRENSRSSQAESGRSKIRRVPGVEVISEEGFLQMNGERGKFFRLRDSQVMIPLDVDLVQYFQKLGRKEKKAYYVLINEALRGAMQEEKPAQVFTKLLRQMVVSEIQKSAAQR